MSNGVTLSGRIRNATTDWIPRLRLYRTLFVNRWHAAVTIGERLNNPSIGERAEQINHAASLSEYLWRFGAFRENPHGTGRIDVNDQPSPANGLHHVFKQLGPYDPKVARTAVHYAIWKFGRYRIEPNAMEELVNSELGALTPDIQKKIVQVANGIRKLQDSMLPFYLDMQYVPPAGKGKFDDSDNWPITAPIFGTDLDQNGKIRIGQDNVPVQGDPILAVHNAFGKNIYNALCWRVRHELAKSNAFVPWRSGMEVQTVGIFDGIYESYSTDDPALRSMLLSLSEPPFPLIVQLCCSVKRAVSMMITALPMFIIRNFFRDTLAAFVLGRHQQAPVLSTMHGARKAIEDLRSGRNEALRDYLLQGGFNSGLAEAEIAAGPADEYIPSSSKYSDLIRKARRTIFVLTRPAWVAEVGTRLTQYQKALDSGATKYQAIRDARMVSTDFANIGSSRSWRMYIGTVPFFNAALQGFDQLYQVWRPSYGRQPHERLLTRDQSKHVAKVRNAGLALTIAVTSVWIWNISDPERKEQYEGETEYEKSAYVTVYDILGEADFRVPVPFQIGAVFMKFPEIVLDTIGSVESLAGLGFFGHLVHGNVSIGWLPAAIKPIWEVETNTNFIGEEIVPPYMQSLQPPSRRHYRSTLSPYILIGEVLNVSPLQVETIVRGYTGHLGNLVMTGLDELAWDSDSNGPKPFPRFLSYASGTGVLVNPGAESTSWWMNYLYDSQDYFPRCARNGTCRGLVGGLNRFDSQVNRFFSANRNRIERISTSGFMARQEKESDINGIYRIMHNRARQFVTLREDLLRQYGED